jgi:8-oxo-dGTP pyrophosphatase MutT (NUDIX family)
MAEDQLLYVGQKAFIAKDGQVLILMDPKLGLDFPGGKIQEGETDFTQALQREVREETGLEIKPGDAFCTWYNIFVPQHRHAGKKVYLVGFKCRYLSGEVILSDEHSSYQWVDKNSYRTLDDGSEYFKALEKYYSS